jgi:hypothetical protein
MKVLGYLVAALMLILGVVGLIAPNRLLAIAQFTTTTIGVYVAAGIRLAIGLILCSTNRVAVADISQG